MGRTLTLCPVCRSKYLVGRHEKSCLAKRPLDWTKYLLTLQRISLDRRGRQEMLDYISPIIGKEEE